eukprot:155604_1
MGKCTSSIPPDHNTVVPFSGTKYVNRNVKSKPQINTRKIKKSRLKEEAKLKAIREKEVADAKRRAVEEKERQKRIEKERLRQKKLEQERLDREKREREKRQREKAARNARLDKEPWRRCTIVGSKIEVYEAPQWYKAKVIEVNSYAGTFKISYDGYNSSYDEFLPMHSTRIAQLYTHTKKQIEPWKRKLKINSKIDLYDEAIYMMKHIQNGILDKLVK